jgi:hypothetical protein
MTNGSSAAAEGPPKTHNKRSEARQERQERCVPLQGHISSHGFLALLGMITGVSGSYYYGS